MTASKSSKDSIKKSKLIRIKRPSVPSITEEAIGLKLTIELIPRNNWYINLRKKYPKIWTKLKKSKEHVTHCEICNTKFDRTIWKKKDLHEVFSYNEETGITKLDKYICICHACHMGKHPGYMSLDSSEKGRKSDMFVIQHFMRINSISYEKYLEIRDEAFNQWERRNKINWTVDLNSALKDAIETTQ